MLRNRAIESSRYIALNSDLIGGPYTVTNVETDFLVPIYQGLVSAQCRYTPSLPQFVRDCTMLNLPNTRSIFVLGTVFLHEPIYII